MDPVPRADALTVRAWGHVRRDFEVRIQMPHARMVHAEYGQVVRRDI